MLGLESQWPIHAVPGPSHAASGAHHLGQRRGPAHLRGEGRRLRRMLGLFRACGDTGVRRVVRGEAAHDVRLQDVDVVGEAARQRPGEALRAEDFGLIVEGPVGGDQDGALLVALADDLEEQLRSGAGQGDKAQLVYDQQVQEGQLSL